MRIRTLLIFAFSATLVAVFALTLQRSRAPQMAIPAASTTGVVLPGAGTADGRENVNVNTAAPAHNATNATSPTPAHQAQLGEPLSDALSRVTKKGFGLKVSPATSPVQPERFSGYHVGVDFETTPAEQDVDVPISVVCDGSLALKERASGYGGVAVQRCMLSGRDVTVIYGHLKLESVTTKVGAVLKRGDRLGILGKGYSVETDGERKHLHLGIHLGRTITIKGYVQTSAELDGWLDARTYLVP